MRRGGGSARAMGVDRQRRIDDRQQQSPLLASVPSNPCHIIAELRSSTQPALNIPRRGAQEGHFSSPSLRAGSGAYDFLLPWLNDATVLAAAIETGRTIGVAPHHVMVAEGAISAKDYARALGGHLGLSLAEPHGFVVSRPNASGRQAQQIWSPVTGGHRRVLDAMAYAPDVLETYLAQTAGARDAFVLASRDEIDLFVENFSRRLRLNDAIHGLWRRDRNLSARLPIALWQTTTLVLLAGLLIGGLLVTPEYTLAVITALLSLPFFCVVLLRAAAALEIARRPRPPDARVRRGPMLDAELPTYSIMVPLFDEAAILPDLVSSLAALDYPAAKLEIILILESVDTPTREAVARMRLPGNFCTMVVPPHGPQTKPKALNYVLSLVRGDFVVVYDAEDRPEPGQLRLALEAFGRGGEDLVCVQARLNVYNAHASFLSRQFALEYSALFDAVLPALERLSLPIPLGGTSNHFRTHALRDLGAWDAFNVTEDADLGIRLARKGLRTATVPSTTWEEAPVTFGNWVRQRTRWLKGWMQTYIVHMRHPWRLARELGPLTFAGFQALMGGILLSMLVHPIFYVVVAWQAWSGHLFAPMETAAGVWFWWIAGINLVLGYSTSILVGALSVARRGRWRLALSSLAMPFYWLLISGAGYRAVIQLVRQPYIWEKTKHGVGSSTTRSERMRRAEV